MTVQRDSMGVSTPSIRTVGERILTVGCLVLVFLLIAVPSRSEPLRAHLRPTAPDLRGEPVTIELKVMARGVGATPDTPLGQVRGRVGDTVVLGSLPSVPERPVEIRVMLPWGSFYHPVSPETLKRGRLSVPVYPAGDNEQLSVLKHQVLVQPFPGRLMFREYLVFRNGSDRLAGGNDDPVILDLPEGIQGLNTGPGLGSEADLRPVNGERGRYAYRLMIPPGRSVLGFFYMLRSPQDPLSVTRSVTLPTHEFVYLIRAVPDLDVRVDGVSERDTAGQKGGRRIRRFTGTDLSPGRTIRLTVRGLSELDPSRLRDGPAGEPPSSSEPGPTEPSSEQGGVLPPSMGSVSWPVLLGIGLSLLVFAGSYGYVHYKLGMVSETGGSGFLVDEIARLDQEYEDGAIPEAYYKRTRRRWKRRAAQALDDESAEL